MIGRALGAPLHLWYKNPMPLKLSFFVFPAMLFAALAGGDIYKKNCAGCHDAGLPRVPTREAFQVFSPEAVNRSLASGAMRFQASSLSLAAHHPLPQFVTLN